MDWLDYREKLGIGFSDDGKFQYFKTILFNKLRMLVNVVLFGEMTREEYCEFCFSVGAELDLSLAKDDLPRSYDDCERLNRYINCLSIIDRHSSYIEECLSYYVAFMNCIRDNNSHNTTREYYKTTLEECLNTAHIPYEVITDTDGYFVFPKGIKEFDDTLVSQPLMWLQDYPEAERAWSKALREYAGKENDQSSDVADLFRKALETFFQKFFAKDQTLQNLKSEYGKYLKSQSIPKEIAQNFEALLQSYITFMDAYAKHHDATSDKVLEYLMYQTGNIMRLLITLKQGEQQDAN